MTPDVASYKSSFRLYVLTTTPRQTIFGWYLHRDHDGRELGTFVYHRDAVPTPDEYDVLYQCPAYTAGDLLRMLPVPSKVTKLLLGDLAYQVSIFVGSDQSLAVNLSPEEALCIALIRLHELRPAEAK